jgi:hypothetical protein
MSYRNSGGGYDLPAPGDILHSQTIYGLEVFRVRHFSVIEETLTTWRADGDLDVENVFTADISTEVI